MNLRDEPSDEQCTIRFVLTKRGASLWIMLALLLTASVFSLPYLDALGFIIRAADLPGAPATAAAWRASDYKRDPDIAIPTRAGNIPGRYYRPALRTRRTVVLIP